jgi:hypothetical protein
MTSPPAARWHSRSPPVPVPKWMTGVPGVTPAMSARMCGQHVAPVVVGRERADPAVEELHGLRAGGDLQVQVVAHRDGEPLHERVPRAGVVEHEALRLEERARAAALDQVRRERERRAREADERHLQSGARARTDSAT